MGEPGGRIIESDRYVDPQALVEKAKPLTAEDKMNKPFTAQELVRAREEYDLSTLELANALRWPYPLVLSFEQGDEDVSFSDEDHHLLRRFFRDLEERRKAAHGISDS